MTDLALDLVFASVLYAVVLIIIGIAARQKRIHRSLAEFFLANRSLGFWVLLLTLFATQYSGNSFIGFPGQTYREGLAYFMSVTFLVVVVSGYTLFAPRLFRAARLHSFITPTDFLERRFRSPAINYLSAAIFIVALVNFLLAQLIALGQVFSTLTNGAVPYWLVVVSGGGIVLSYQLLGGLRAVAWADVFQGLVLMAGLFLIGVFVWVEVGSPAAVLRTAQLLRPEAVASPDLTTSFVWLSNLMLLALGAPIYPQAIQRIFAARRLRDLRNALATMAVIPLFAVTVVIFVGMAGVALFPQLDRFAADQVTFRVVAYLHESTDLAYYPAILLALAVMAAILSTADSCLLTLTSIITKDVLARRKGLADSEFDTMAPLVPWISMAVVVVVIVLAMRPLTTLWGLLIIKFEVLIQLSPAFVLGTLHEREDPNAFGVREILAGLVTGLVVTLGLYLSGYESVYGFHAGSVGVLLNYLVVVGLRAARRSRLPISITSS